MKTKEIIKKLENLFGKSHKQKSKDKQLESITKLIGLLEVKEKKFRDKLKVLEDETSIPRYKRKLQLTELHIAKAKAYKLELESQKKAE